MLKLHLLLLLYHVLWYLFSEIIIHLLLLKMKLLLTKLHLFVFLLNLFILSNYFLLIIIIVLIVRLWNNLLNVLFNIIRG